MQGKKKEIFLNPLSCRTKKRSQKIDEKNATAATPGKQKELSKWAKKRRNNVDLKKRQEKRGGITKAILTKEVEANTEKRTRN